MESDILCQRDGAIATVTLFNPDKLNALNARMWSRLREAMHELADDDSLRGVILRGEGAAFAAGFAGLRAFGPAATTAFLLFFLPFVAMSLLP